MAMTNDELVAAIEAAFQLTQRSGPLTTEHAIAASHYEALIKEQARRAAAPDRASDNAARNQCDGCARGLPISDGLHREPFSGLPVMSCTADRYAPAAPPAGRGEGEVKRYTDSGGRKRMIEFPDGEYVKWHDVGRYIDTLRQRLAEMTAEHDDGRADKDAILNGYVRMARFVAYVANDTNDADEELRIAAKGVIERDKTKTPYASYWIKEMSDRAAQAEALLQGARKDIVMAAQEKVNGSISSASPANPVAATPFAWWRMANGIATALVGENPPEGEIWSPLYRAPIANDLRQKLWDAERRLAEAQRALADCPNGYDEYGVYYDWRSRHADAMNAAIDAALESGERHG